MIEFLELYTEDGLPTGKTKARSAVHKDADWHKTVHVWIVNDLGQLLMQKRHPKKYSHPGEWDISSAGHIEAGSQSILTAIKETKEEIGLEVRVDELELLFTARNSDVIGNGYVDNEFQDVYLVKKNIDPAALVWQADEVAGVKLIHYRELEQLIAAGDREYVPHPDEYPLLFAELHKRFA